MRIKDIKLALSHYESCAKRASKDPTGLPKSTSANCYDPKEPNHSVANRVKWNIEYTLGGGYDLNVFEYPWLTFECNPLSPYSVY